MRLRGMSGAAVAALVVAMAATPPALAETDDGRIDVYDIAYTVQADGTVDVVEEFQFDFGATPNHGPERLIDTIEPATDDKDRIYRLDDIEVSSPSGAPAYVDVEEIGNQTRIRIGDPAVELFGRQTYRLSYTLVGALNAQPNGTGELFWDAAGPHWRVPIDHVTVTVVAPGGISKQCCIFGYAGSTTACSSKTLADGKATFRQDEVRPGEVLTIVAAFSLADVRVPEPELREATSSSARSSRRR